MAVAMMRFFVPSIRRPMRDTGPLPLKIAARNSQRIGAGIIAPGIPMGGRAFAVRMEMSESNGIHTHETVVRLTDEPLHPYWVLSWKSN
jgi:hypothetical protein